MTTDLVQWIEQQDIPSGCKTRLRRLSISRGIRTVDEVCAYTWAGLYLKAGGNLGRISIAHLQRCLAAEGRFLRGEGPKSVGIAEALEQQIARLRRDCAEAYQVIDVLADELGLMDDPEVIKALDNLTAASSGKPRPHDDLLPFWSQEAA